MTNSNDSSNTDHPERPVGTGGRGSVCPLCGGAGFLSRDVPLGHPEFGKILPCSCQTPRLEAARLADLRTMSNLEATSRYTVGAFRPEGAGLTEEMRQNLRKAYETARAFAVEPAGWLLFLGGYGCGKTHLAAAIANEQLACGRGVLFVVVPDLLDHLRATFSPSSNVSYDHRFDEIRTAPFLVLDDLGAQSASPWAKEKLHQLFNYRYNAELPTVLTVAVDMLESIDERLRVRLQDERICTICIITAPAFHGGRSKKTRK